MRLKAGSAVIWKGVEESVCGSAGISHDDYLITVNGDDKKLQVVNGLALEIETFYNYCPEGPERKEITDALHRVEQQGIEWGRKAVKETFERLEDEIINGH